MTICMGITFKHVHKVNSMKQCAEGYSNQHQSLMTTPSLQVLAMSTEIRSNGNAVTKCPKLLSLKKLRCSRKEGKDIVLHGEDII
jgi:hypothetical protein